MITADQSPAVDKGFITGFLRLYCGIVPHLREVSWFLLAITCCHAIDYAVRHALDIAGGVVMLAGLIYGTGGALKAWKSHVDRRTPGTP